jgi:cytochrome bd-type quinol oxidase subunit 2
MKLLAKLLSFSLFVMMSEGIWFAGSAGALAVITPTPAVVSSVAANEACQGAGLGSGSACNSSSALQINTTLGAIINIFSAIVGLVAVIMIIVAGLQFITASGNAQNIAKARSTLLYAIVGLVIVVLAQVIVHFIINQATTAAK